MKDGSIVLFIINRNDKNNKIENKENKEHKLTEDELIQIKKWLDEYEAMKMIKRCLKTKSPYNNGDNNLISLDSRETQMNFLEFIKKKNNLELLLLKNISIN